MKDEKEKETVDGLELDLEHRRTNLVILLTHDSGAFCFRRRTCPYERNDIEFAKKNKKSV